MGYAAAAAGVADSSSTTCATQALAVSAADVIAVGAMCMEIFSGQTISNVTDTAGNTYTRQTASAVSENGAQAEWWVCNNASAHANNVATVTWSAAARYKACVQIRLTGMNNSSAVADADKADVAGSATVTTPTMTSAGACTVLQYRDSATAWNDTVTAVASSSSNCVISAVVINPGGGAATSDVPRRRRSMNALLAM